MNINEKMDLLKNYMAANVAPILLEGIDSDVFNDAVILPANISNLLLTGHYENEKYVYPDWYQSVNLKASSNINLLIIDDITNISKEEQLKFKEILKYRKIDSFSLPSNCIIIVLASRVNKDLINDEIYSLVAHI